VRRSYKFRAYPTARQEIRARQLLADHCDLYNAALQERRDAYRHSQTKIRYGDQSAQLKDIRRDDPDGQGAHSFTSQQQTLRRLHTVFVAFYQRAQKGEAGYPRFKSRSRFDQVMFVAGDGSTWEPATGRWAQARLQAVGTIKVKQHRPVRGTVKTIQLKREHRRWYLIVVADQEPEPLPETGRQVGVDVGVARFYTTSDGEIADNPRFLKQAAEQISELQRRKARCRRGSGNRRRARQALAKAWRKVGNQRRDFHHRQARRLVDTCDAIGVEQLNVAGMTRRPQPRPDDAGGYAPNGAAAKSGLNRSILDAGWSQFVGILAAKAEDAGRRVVAVNPAFTSIDCHRCGTRCTRPCRDTVVCPRCGEIDADLNGARNIYTRAGLGSGQAAA
jgi:putative transposase